MSKEKNPKYIFVVGGVMSSVGKGVATASIAKIMQSRGFSVTAMKADPYLNIDAGTMSPTEHGEVFVTEDADEGDQDLGNYERFLDVNIHSINYMTLGRVLKSVLDKERALKYKGKCVEFFYHTPLEIVERIKAAQQDAQSDITVIEVGGTIGEYQNILFLEAGRMMQLERPDDVAFVMVTYLPVPKMVGEMKTKPTQTAVRMLNGTGVQPDILVCRAEVPIDSKRKEKIALSCGMKPDTIVSAPDADSIYSVPLNFKKEGLDEILLDKLQLSSRKHTMHEWEAWLKSVKRAKKTVKIGIVGKYFATGEFTLADSYISVIESLKFAAWHAGATPELVWLDAEAYEKDARALKELKKYDGILVPGGFGSRGTEGKVKAAQYCREHKIPYFGICLGLQIMVIEYARNVLGLKGATSEEFAKKPTHPVVHIIPEQKEKLAQENYGNTMRLGAYPCKLIPKSIVHKAYSDAGWIKKTGKPVVQERHRHRYEVNNEYRDQLNAAGLKIAGVYEKGNLVEAMEVEGHPFMVGIQSHPEFLSRPMNPHPLFYQFVKAALRKASSG